MRAFFVAMLALVGIAACGGNNPAAELEQPRGCLNGREPARSAFGPDDVRVGDAVIMALRAQERASWRELWRPDEAMGVVKLPIVVPAGETLTLTVPPEVRGTFALFYEGERPGSIAEGAKTARLTACRGAHPSVGFPGQLLVARPVCRAPLDFAYGSERGRLEMSFGGACG